MGGLWRRDRTGGGVRGVNQTSRDNEGDEVVEEKKMRKGHKVRSDDVSGNASRTWNGVPQ